MQRRRSPAHTFEENIEKARLEAQVASSSPVLRGMGCSGRLGKLETASHISGLPLRGFSHQNQ